MGLLCWTSAKDTELEPFIPRAGQMWGDRTDFASMYKTEGKKLT